jgi:molybdopterin molybdotransferase
MLSVAEAREKIMTHIQPVDKIIVPLAQIVGRVLATNISAKFDLPIFDNSGVDGFAVRSKDLSSSQPSTLRVIADIPAGNALYFTLNAGDAARIMTGAPLPAGADAVVMVEDTDFDYKKPGIPLPEFVTLSKPVIQGENIRRHGADISAGQEIFPAGHTIRPQDIGMLAMLGAAQVSVYRRPRVAIFSSGDELVKVDVPLTPGKIYETNSYSLAALAEQLGAEVISLGVAADKLNAVQSLLELAVQRRADMIISSAGVSVGAYDFVKEAVETNGNLDFWKVNMRPGKPLAFGNFRGVTFFGLPGNPVSAFVSFLIFVAPAIKRLAGTSLPLIPTRRVIAGETIESDGRESYLRAIVTHENGQDVARLTGHQGSGNLFSLVQANALLIIPSGVKSVPLNKEVDAWMI